LWGGKQAETENHNASLLAQFMAISSRSLLGSIPYPANHESRIAGCILFLSHARFLEQLQKEHSSNIAAAAATSRSAATVMPMLTSFAIARSKKSPRKFNFW